MTEPATTSFPSPFHSSNLDRSEKIKQIACRFKEIMEILGLDVTDPSLEKTPDRVAKMYVDEIFSGICAENFPPISFMSQVGQEGSMVFTKVSFHSTCEHHFVPMSGYAYVAYIPNEKLIGLSKISRIVRFFAKRPQVQERLTAQIADSLAIVLESDDVAVSTTLEHMCVKMRGIEDEGGFTTVNVLRGAFKNDPQREKEFFESVNRKG